MQPSSGTPFYMAPELHDGGVHSTASDLWALGCVLYQCAAGRLPFQAPMLEELIDNIKFAPPQPLSGAGRAQCPGLPCCCQSHALLCSRPC